MKKLNITKEQYKESEYAKKYGNLKYVSESSTGRLFKTDKGQILKFVAEAREYVDDSSIEADSADEFIIFDDPEILNKIASVQSKEEKKVQQEIEKQDITKQDVGEVAQEVASGETGPGIGAQVASSAISGATSIVTNPTVISIAAGAYGLNKVKNTVGGWLDDWDNIQRCRKNNELMRQSIERHSKELAKNGVDFNMIMKGQDYVNSLSDSQMEKLGFNAIPDEGFMHNMEYHKLVANGLPEKDRSAYLKSAQNVCDKYGAAAATGAGSAAAAGAGAAASGGAGAGTTIFGMSLATIGWIAAGVAAAAVITPYIYDKVRACTKTWMADIIAEVKFKADGKNYRCFYDLKKNKWVLTYADIKWTSYLDNKLDDETKDEFFASKFFQEFLNKCRKAFAMLFSTSRNEIVFKTLPEIKDAPKELKSILEKIYDNKGAITKNMFTGNHE